MLTLFERVQHLAHLKYFERTVAKERSRIEGIVSIEGIDEFERIATLYGIITFGIYVANIFRICRFESIVAFDV